MHYDIFNGDADGLCSLHQLRLAQPMPEARRITGVKRDTLLLARIGDLREGSVTVLDISLDSNRSSLLRLLEQRNEVLYIDHHFAEDIPVSPFLTAHIDPHPWTCTSLLVDSLLQGRFSLWAICGAFGDNLHRPARQLASTCSLSEQQILQLQEIGELLNYNSYGETIEDLHFSPLALAAELAQFIDPLHFFASSSLLSSLRHGYQEDMDFALSRKEHGPSGKNRVYFFPGAAWARRVAGIFANRKAREMVEAAHALITENSDGSWRVSVRAPLSDSRNADTLCRRFPTGGGRAGAAGINNLPAEMLESFLAAFHATYR
jgi:hypothetical protein